MITWFRRKLAILATHTLTPYRQAVQEFADLLSGGVSLWQTFVRPLRLYHRAVRKFREAGATWREALNLPLAVPALMGGASWVNDLAHGFVGGMCLKIAAYTTNQTGTAVDMIEGFGNLFGIALFGTQTDGSVALKLTESDTSGGSYSDVAGGAFTKGATGDDDVFEIVTGRRTKRYVKAASTVTGSPSTGGVYGVMVLQMKKAGN